jgi:hypothetical protein
MARNVDPMLLEGDLGWPLRHLERDGIREYEGSFPCSFAGSSRIPRNT